MSKLVRDKIPTLIGPNARYHVADDAEYVKALSAKLVEEAREFQEKPSHEELADVLEVISAILKGHGWTMLQVSEVRTKKADARGKFEKKFILEDSV